MMDCNVFMAETGGNVERAWQEASNFWERTADDCVRWDACYDIASMTNLNDQPQ
ncbi:MAG: hypothetical protein AAFX78_06760 [Cyanobacteria bacterium J06638_20]